MYAVATRCLFQPSGDAPLVQLEAHQSESIRGDAPLVLHAVKERGHARSPAGGCVRSLWLDCRGPPAEAGLGAAVSVQRLAQLGCLPYPPHTSRTVTTHESYRDHVLWTVTVP